MAISPALTGLLHVNKQRFNANFKGICHHMKTNLQMQAGDAYGCTVWM